MTDWRRGRGTLRPEQVCDAAILGAGPAGLIAAEVLASIGHRVTLYDRMPSPARKFLMAGRGGLNLTHSEPLETFLTRYHDPSGALRRAVEAFAPSALIGWANGLGARTFIGSSGRVFPEAMKASPLLRAWLKRLGDLGVALETRCTFAGFSADGRALIKNAGGKTRPLEAGAVLLALGGASWPRLGADGSWAAALRVAGVAITPLEPANAGVLIAWSETFRTRFQGQPLKRIALSIDGETSRGEAVVTAGGLEGGSVYALSRAIRKACAAGPATLAVDLAPGKDVAQLAAALAKGKTSDTLTNTIRKTCGLAPVAIALLRETAGPLAREPALLAAHIKNAELRLEGLAGLERAISTAGGIAMSELNERFMLKRLPGVFAAGEMLDWEAPTGGYLLQATFATGVAAAYGMADWLASGQAGSPHPGG